MNYELNRKQTELKRIEERLEILDEQLHEYKKEILIAIGGTKINLKQQLKREILSTWEKEQQVYSKLLIELASEQTLNPLEAEAEPLVGELIRNVEQFKQHQINLSSELTQILQQILDEVQMVNKSATARLRVSLPIIPLLASYDLTLDTESVIAQSLRKIQSVFRKGIETNPQ